MEKKFLISEELMNQMVSILGNLPYVQVAQVFLKLADELKQPDVPEPPAPTV